MSNEIKEILEGIEETSKEQFVPIEFPLTIKECKILRDYITNLQEKVDQYENPDDLTLITMYCDLKAKDKIKKLQKENERLKEILHWKQIEDNIFYKSRCEKALEFIDKYCIDDEFYINLTYKEKAIIEVKKILQGDDN